MRSRIAIFAFAAALAASGPAVAQNGFDLRQNYDAEQARDARRSGDVQVTGSQAIMIAQARYPGSEYLELFLSGGDMPVYTVRLKTADGRRVDVKVDARTGEVRGGR